VSKLRVGLLFGGISTEHEVSISSATTILKGLDPARYSSILIGLAHDGSWHISSSADLLPEAVFDSPESSRCFPSLQDGLAFLKSEDGQNALDGPIDVLFPIIHGRGGEDGSLQGVFEAAGLPYVGPAVLSTALCMNKMVSKQVLREAGVPVLPAHEASREEVLRTPEGLISRVERDFGYPVFVKPTNTGSSVGVSKASDRDELAASIRMAADYDLDVLVEPAVDAREVECAVLGGHDPQASVLGEVGYRSEFYDYEAKYISDATELVIPAPLADDVAERIRACSVEAFRALRCWGLARVDFFVRRDTEEVILNELNTLPGFTDGSMYPRLWDASGIALPELLHRLIELALERQREQAALKTRYES
jgi:D-alanine-D-alanine ligase